MPVFLKAWPAYPASKNRFCNFLDTILFLSLIAVPTLVCLPECERALIRRAGEAKHFFDFGPVSHLKMAIRERRETSYKLQITNRHSCEGGLRRPTIVS